MKLELKHLAPYLPYELGIKYEGLATQYLREDTLHLIGLCLSKSWKPILRPLSDLLDENGKYFKEVQHMCLWKDCKHSEYSNFKIECDEVKMNTGAISFIGSYFVNGEYEFIYFIYNDYQWLFENHFDIFGLIDKGLAIDINTI